MKRMYVFVIAAVVLSISAAAFVYFRHMMLPKNQAVSAGEKTDTDQPFERDGVGQPLRFSLFTNILTDQERIMEILAGKELDPAKVEIPIPGYNFSFEDLREQIPLEKKGIIVINNNGVNYHEISGFNINANKASGILTLTYKLQNDNNNQADNNFWNNINILNIDKDYLTKHKIYLNNASLINDKTQLEEITKKSYYVYRKKYSNSSAMLSGL